MDKQAQTNRHIDKYTHRQIHTHTNTQTDKYTNRQIHKQTYSHTDIYKYIHSDNQRNRQKYEQTVTQRKSAI